MISIVTATYSGPDVADTTFKADPSRARYKTTAGKTTGASAWVLNAGHDDIDKPSDAKKNSDGTTTYLGSLRCQLTGVQDDINDFLTKRMEQEKGKRMKPNEEKRIEEEIKELLDGGEDAE